MTVESLAELTSTLVDAAAGWRDLVLALSAEAKRQHEANAGNPSS